MRIEVRRALTSLDSRSWNELVGDGSPFLEWEWLASLEEAGCVSPQTGWLPQHLTVWEGKHLVGACPLYVKGNSQGEFVFDHGWAEAAQRAGLAYYPKLLVGVPFTPVAGRRFLSGAGVNRSHVVSLLATTLAEICRDRGFSSAHVNFCEADEVAALSQAGFQQRTGYQFQWRRHGWGTFEDYLSAFRSKRRIQIRRERRELASQGVEIRVHAGDEIQDALFEPMFRLYRTTIEKHYWGHQYLNRAMFELLGQRWRPRLVFFVARRRGEIVAGTFTVRKGAALYGRYWGAFEELRHLHFNVCYYASIEYCLEQGMERFEPGAGGEFKYLRGFDPHPTVSMHYITDPRFAAAVHEFLARERGAVERQIEWLEEKSPVRRAAGEGD